MFVKLGNRWLNLGYVEQIEQVGNEIAIQLRQDCYNYEFVTDYEANRWCTEVTNRYNKRTIKISGQVETATIIDNEQLRVRLDEG